MREKLLTEQNTHEVMQQVIASFSADFDYEPDEVVFEHGQWWVKCWPTDATEEAFYDAFGDEEEVTFSVIDVEGVEGGLGFERV